MRPGSSAALMPPHEADASRSQTSWVQQQFSPPYFGRWEIILRVIVRNWWCLRMVRGAQGVTDNTLVCFSLGLKAWQALRRSLGVRGLPLRALCKGISKANPRDACFHMQNPFFFFFFLHRHLRLFNLGAKRL